MTLTNYLKNCFFLGNTITEVEANTPFILKNILYYIILGTIVKSNTSDPVNGSIEMVMRIIIALVFVSSLLYWIKQLPLFSNLFLAVIVCENFFMTLAVIKEFLVLFSLISESNYIIQYSSWILLIWHISVLIFILKKILPFSSLITFLFAVSYYGMMTYGSALFIDLLF